MANDDINHKFSTTIDKVMNRVASTVILKFGGFVESEGTDVTFATLKKSSVFERQPSGGGNGRWLRW